MAAEQLAQQLAQRLAQLNRQVAVGISRLPPSDPMRLSTREEQEADAESVIERVIEKTCIGDFKEFEARIKDEYFRAGPLEPLFLDPDITEVIVNGADSIWFERRGQLQRLPDKFLSALTYRNFISRLSREAGFEATLACPFADGRWRDCRVHLIIPPASGDQAVLTLRRHPTSPWTFERFRNIDWASERDFTILTDLVRQRKNFLVIGATGSGKTSVLNACLGELGDSERCLIIEDTDELRIPNAVSSKLLTRHDAQGILRGIDQSDLLRQALRMRPDRIVMGEIRGGEAKDLLMAFATGHTGCMGTLHAESARQALLRMEMLVQLGAPQWSLHAVRTLIWLSVQAIVVVGKTSTGERRLDGIYRVASLEDVGFLLEKAN